MTTYFKATKPDGTSFHDGKTTWQVGRITRLGEPTGDKLCDERVLHAGTVAAETLVGGSWPCRLFEVEPRSRVLTDIRHPHKVGAAQWKVIREIPAWKALGPNGCQVVALIERCETLTPTEIGRLHAAGKAARNAARCAAGEAAWDAAVNAAWDADLNAALNAVRDAARDAALALVVKDLITSEHFQSLHGPWQSVVKGVEQ